MSPSHLSHRGGALSESVFLMGATVRVPRSSMTGLRDPVPSPVKALQSRAVAFLVGLTTVWLQDLHQCARLAKWQRSSLPHPCRAAPPAVLQSTPLCSGQLRGMKCLTHRPRALCVKLQILVVQLHVRQTWCLFCLACLVCNICEKIYL